MNTIYYDVEKNGKDLVTIVIPVYNTEKYIKRCMDSILKQDYYNLEILLINDGSCDGSKAICEAYLYDSRVRLIDKNNEGLSSVRQMGVDQAKGKYLCTIDSDDYIAPQYIGKMYEVIEKSKADICVCAVKHEYKDSSIVFGFSKNSPVVTDITKDQLAQNYYAIAVRYYMSDSWNKLYRLDFIKKSNVRFTLKREYIGTDLLFNYCLLMHLPKIASVNEPLYLYQIIENSKTRSKKEQMQKGFNYIIDMLITEVGKTGMLSAIYSQLSFLYVLFSYMIIEDIIKGSKDMKVLKIQLDRFYQEHINYLSRRKMLRINACSTRKITLMIVSCCLQGKNKNRVFAYFMIRKHLLKFTRKA